MKEKKKNSAKSLKRESYEFDPPARYTKRARRAPRCHWMLPANFRARTKPSPRSTPTTTLPLPLLDIPFGVLSTPVARTASRLARNLHVPTPLLRASSIIFVQARKLQSGDGGERITRVAGLPGGSLENRETRVLSLACGVTDE